VRIHSIASRPHVQGSPAPLRLRHSAGELTDGAGLLLLRRLWDRLGLGERIDTQARWLRGEYRPSLMVELWAEPLRRDLLQALRRIGTGPPLPV
jgi:hypothetical protein